MNKYQVQMNTLRWERIRVNQGQSVTLEEIQQIEQKIGYSFPLDYVEFLINYGVCGFEDYVDFPFLDPYPRDERGLISVFFGIMPNDCYGLLENYQTYLGRMPFHFLPIATDPGSNIICLSLDKKDKNAVYFWDHNEEEMVEEGQNFSYSNIYLLARSFNEFINSLEILEDDEDE